MKLFGQKVAALVRSPIFFGVIIVAFVLQALWIAVSARYPMAFDEAFHTGIIKLYAHQWNPLLARQPPGMAPYGALTTDPSYLYHYLMSFPYRLLTGLVSNPILVIVYLRIINVALFATSLIVFRRVLLKTKASPAIVHTSLLFFVLIPIVPLLAAHVNYDNLLILLVALTLLLTLGFKEQLQKDKRCNIPLLACTLSLSLLASLVKFAYLPILTAIALYLAYLLLQFARSGKRRQHIWQKSWSAKPLWQTWLAIAVFVLCSGLFLQRYGYNTLRYHNLVPQCGQVLSVQQCQAYAPWARNYDLAIHKPPRTFPNPLIFAGGWLVGMFDRSFFAINGPGPVAQYDNKWPLPLMSIAAVVTFLVGTYAAFRFRRQVIYHDSTLLFLLLVSTIYLVALIGRNYHDYMQLGGLVAINGRYLILIILPILLAMGLAYQRLLLGPKQAMLAVVVFVLFLQGGGFISFIYISNNHWYRSDSQLVISTNQRAHRLIHPFILDWPGQ